MTRFVAALVAVVATTVSGTVEAPSAEHAYRNASLPVPQRVAALLSLMTQEEKVAQLLHPWDFGGNNTAEILSRFQNTSVGSLYVFWLGDGQCGSNVTCSLGEVMRVQQALVSGSRLGIPATIVQETLHGGASQGAVFPMPCGLGATWNPLLMQQIGAVIAAEAYATGVDRGFSPELQTATDPRFSRLEENYGEDPLLVSALGAAMAYGMQGQSSGGADTYLPSGALVCEAKHFAAYAFGGKDGYAADISDRTLFDVYLRPWRSYAQIGGRGLMCSHNELNSVPMHANARLLQDVMRTKFGFGNGFAASDATDIGNLMNFGVALNTTAAAALAVTAGVDQDLGMVAYPNLTQAVASGLASQASVDASVARILTSKFAAGLFDGAWRRDPANLAILDSPAHRQLARQAASEGIILLQNSNGLLPWSPPPAGAKILITGPNADDASAQLGGYSNSGSPVVTVLGALQNASAALNLQVTYEQGCDIMSRNLSGIPAAVAAAAQADLVIAVVGDTALGYGKGSCAEGIDRDSLDLAGGQLPLLAALANATSKLVVVLIHGRPATFGADVWSPFGSYNSLLNSIPALLSAWRPGEEGGNAVLDIVLGRVNPSGRLAQSWPQSAGRVHQFTPWFTKRSTPTAAYAPDNQPTSPLFPFGFGLSYSSISITAASIINSPSQPASGVWNVTASVSVHGPAASVVVQVYFAQALSQYSRYNRMLAGFAKVSLPGGGVTTAVNIAIPVSTVASYFPDPVDDYVVEAGSYTLYVAQYSTDSSAIAVPVTVTSTNSTGRVTLSEAGATDPGVFFALGAQ